MKSPIFSMKGLLLIAISLIFATFAINYAGAITMKKDTNTTTKAKISCTAGSEPNTRGTKCNVCTPGSISAKGLSCRACRGENIAKNSGATSCTPCKAGTVANKSHTACIKQGYVSGERKIR